MCNVPPRGSYFLALSFGAAQDLSLITDLETLRGGEGSSQEGSVVLHEARIGEPTAASSGRGRPTFSVLLLGKAVQRN